MLMQSGDPAAAWRPARQSVVIEPGEGWSPTGPWWYFEINRLGSSNDYIQVIAVALEY